MPTVGFATESKAEPLLIASRGGGGGNTVVDLTPDGAEKRSGSVDVPTNEWVALTWVFSGSPGDKYTITITPEDKVELKRSANPISSSISTQRTVGSGSDLMRVKP